MNKRQSKKQYNKFINGNQRYGCEYCCGMTGRYFRTNDGWLDISLGKKYKFMKMGQQEFENRIRNKWLKKLEKEQEEKLGGALDE